MSTVAAAQPARPFAGRLVRTLSDERLVARVRRGDQAAFEVVYDRYHRQLLSFCRHMLGSNEEAEDALQQTCISAYEAMRSDDRPIQLKAWLFTIARNRCLTMLRARREHADIHDHEPTVDGLVPEVQRRADLRELLADLHRLPEDQRAALVLSELGAHSHEEIAVILGVRKEKVKALVFQARDQLSGARAAREVDCSEIREQLATLRGGALRRTQLRRHVETCPGCAAFRADVQRQRAAMAVMLPVIPGAALKSSVLGAVFGGGGAASGLGGGGALAAGGGAAAGALGTAGTGGGGLFAMIGAQGAAVKALAILAVAGGAGGTGYVAVEELSASSERPANSATPATPAVPAVPGVAPATPAVPATPSATALERRAAAAERAKKAKTKAKARRKGDKARGRERAAKAKRSGKETSRARRSSNPSGARGTTRTKPAATTRSTGRPALKTRTTRTRTKTRVTRRRGTTLEESTTSGSRRILESETKGRPSDAG